MGREVRRVAPDWKHPRTETGAFKPLKDGYTQAVCDWDGGRVLWAEGHHKFPGGMVFPLDDDLLGTLYEQRAGPRPVPTDYLRCFALGQDTHLMMYETTSEGTPISPAFATAEELARWLADTRAPFFADHTASYEVWIGVINGTHSGMPTMTKGRLSP